MKHFFLTVSFVTATIFSAFAENHLTKAENDAAIRMGRQQVSTIMLQFEQSVRAKNPASIKTNVVELEKLMRKGMVEAGNTINFEPKEKQAESARKYNSLEMEVHQFHQLSKDPVANAQQLLEQAKEFQKRY
ncbi:MAG: hypothetical protein ABI378_08610 [Chitinophagaceae bacterium]